MPELPEVETIKKDLLPLVGRRITGVELLSPQAVRCPSVEEFRRGLMGREIRGLWRRGKYLIFHLSEGRALLLHFRMSGSLMHRNPGASPDDHTRAVLRLDNGRELRFCDRRKLGGLWLVEKEGELLDKLGPEPLDAQFTPEYLAAALKRRSAPIKALLLDQTFLAGMGNIYADEALFAARIHPERPAKSLTPEEAKRLHGAIRQVLEQGIANRGTTFSDYRDASGERGANQEALSVYGRTAAPCPICKTPIERLSLRGRGSHFCPKCQE